MTLELRDVSKVVDGDTHIYDTSLVLERGGFNVLLGSTLAGKTTLMRIMAGLDRPSRGRVLFNDKDVTGVSVRRRNIAMVYQQFINYSNLTVFDNIASPLRIARKSKQEVERRVGEVAELLKLSPLLNRRPNELSGGQQQRTALARALVKGSELVLLDEPLVNLDYKLREELREELPQLFADTGATVVYATAEPMEALLLGGHTATLHKGRVTQFGVTGQVFRNPNNLETAQTFSDPPLNTSTMTKSGARVMLPGGVSWPVPTTMGFLRDGRYQLGFRAHHLTLQPQSEHSIRFHTQVQITEITGSESFVHVRAHESDWVAQTHEIQRFDVGAALELFVEATKFLVFTEDGQRIETG